MEQLCTDLDTGNDGRNGNIGKNYPKHKKQNRVVFWLTQHVKAANTRTNDCKFGRFKVMISCLPTSYSEALFIQPCDFAPDSDRHRGLFVVLGVV